MPEPEQRTWRLMTRGRLQLVRERVRLQSQVECLLEAARIKLSSVISDLPGVSGRRILEALSKGQTDAAKLAALGDDRLKCTKEQLADALRGAPEPGHRQLLHLHLERLQLLDEQIRQLSQMNAAALNRHPKAVARLAEVPGFGVESSQQMIAEVGVDAEAFDSAGEFASWAGVCPGSDVSPEENHSSRCPKGNRYVRRILSEAAHAAVKKKGSHFQNVFRRNGAIWVVAHRLARLVWKILHDQVSYVEQGQDTDPRARKHRAAKLARALRKLRYSGTLAEIHPQPVAEAST
ncbi:MAG: transposase [Bryobacteraceae bacterium]